MDKQKIYNQYAKEQGYKNWSAILFQFQDDFNYASPEDENNVMNWIEHHINTVTDLIQEELKKKIHNELNEVHFNNRTDFEDCRKEVLNTEIL